VNEPKAPVATVTRIETHAVVLVATPVIWWQIPRGKWEGCQKSGSGESQWWGILGGSLNLGDTAHNPQGMPYYQSPGDRSTDGYFDSNLGGFKLILQSIV